MAWNRAGCSSSDAPEAAESSPVRLQQDVKKKRAHGPRDRHRRRGNSRVLFSGRRAVGVELGERRANGRVFAMDKDAFLEGVGRVRAIARQPALREFGLGAEILPGAGDPDAFLRAQASSFSSSWSWIYPGQPRRGGPAAQGSRHGQLVGGRQLHRSDADRRAYGGNRPHDRGTCRRPHDR